MLTPEDITAIINRSRSVSPCSLERDRDESQMGMDEVMPALSSKFLLSSLLSVSYSFPFILLVMRTGTGPASTGDDDFVFSTPAAPPPSHHRPTG